MHNALQYVIPEGVMEADEGVPRRAETHLKVLLVLEDAVQLEQACVNLPASFGSQGGEGNTILVLRRNRMDVDVLEESLLAFSQRTHNKDHLAVWEDSS